MMHLDDAQSMQPLGMVQRSGGDTVSVSVGSEGVGAGGWVIGPVIVLVAFGLLFMAC